MYQALFIFTKINQQHLLIGKESKFISTVLRSTGGEKDPKNLNVYFKLYEFLLTLNAKFLEKDVETIFDNLQCYYPITFELMEEEKAGISKM